MKPLVKLHSKMTSAQMQNAVSEALYDWQEFEKAREWFSLLGLRVGILHTLQYILKYVDVEVYYQGKPYIIKA